VFVLERRFKDRTVFAEEKLAVDQVNVATNDVLVFGALEGLTIFLSCRL